MVATLLAALPALAADPAIPFEKYKLGNGLTVILSEDHRLPQVAVNVWYHVGAANQVPGKRRLCPPVRAHDVPGLQARGSKALRYSRASGGEHSGSMANGSTTFDRTNYFEVVP